MKKDKLLRFLYIYTILISFSSASIMVFNFTHKTLAKKSFASSELNLYQNLEFNMNEKVTPIKIYKEQKIVYITFDDGPSNYSGGILDILKSKNIKATFFYIGNNINKQPNILIRTVKEGHYVGLHSMSHNYNSLYLRQSSNLITEMKQTQDTVYKYTKLKPNLIRVPYGSFPQVRDKQRSDLSRMNFKMWDWTLDSNDWRHSSNPDLIVKHIEEKISKNNEVILFHEKKQTLIALPKVIDLLKSKGYTFKVYKSDEHINVNFWNDKKL